MKENPFTPLIRTAVIIDHEHAGEELPAAKGVCITFPGRENWTSERVGENQFDAGVPSRDCKIIDSNRDNFE